VSLSCARDGDVYRLLVPGCAAFRIERDARTILCRPLPGIPLSTLRHLLIDQVLPRALTHRGRLVIHAAGCVTPWGAVGFLGDSGSGKSTLSAAMARVGHPLLGDDGLSIGRGAGGGFAAIGTYPGLRLLEGPMARLLAPGAGTAAVAHYTSKRRVDSRAESLPLVDGPRRLSALYRLETGPATAIAPLPRREAFLEILRGSFLLHHDDPGRSSELFSMVGAVADAVPVRTLSYPREYGWLDEVCRAVVADAAPPYTRAACASPDARRSRAVTVRLP
jgi:hypothetical protein